MWRGRRRKAWSTGSGRSRRPWLGIDLPVAMAETPSASLEVQQTGIKPMEEGVRYEYTYKWTIRGRATPPELVNVDVNGAKDLRVIDMKSDMRAKTGTFAVTTTKATDPARYDLYISGRLRTDDGDEIIYLAPDSVRSNWRTSQCEISWRSCRCLLQPLFGADVTFLRDVAPILNKVGCTSGPCHGAAKGKNGFKLSLRGYDPQFDYEALLYDLYGRRFNRAEPARSLMLAKPTQQVPHGGGLRFEVGSEPYKIIYDWIAQGVPFGDPAKDTVRRLEVEPKEIFLKAPGEGGSVKVTATYADGGSRDVTKLAVVESNIPDVATVADAAVTGARIGEATLLVRYQGNLSTLPVTVLNPKPGFAWKALPENNYIDRIVDAKLQRLKIQPSAPVDDAGFLRRVSLDLTGQLPTPEEVRAFVADASKTKRAAKDRKIDRKSRFCRSLDPQMGRFAAK